MENDKAEMKRWQKVLRTLSVVSALISLAFLVMYLVDIFAPAQYIFWITMTFAQCLDAFVTFDKKSKFSIFKLTLWTFLLTIWVILLVCGLL